MSQHTALLRRLSPARFVNVLAASSRQARETYFHRHAIRAPKATGFVRAGARQEARALALHHLLASRDDDELAQEILRTYLMRQRPLLVAALDALKIPHQDGLTDDPGLARFAELTPAAAAELATTLTASATPEDVWLYLAFMGAPVDGLAAAP